MIGMEYCNYTAGHLYNKHRVLSDVHRMFLLYVMGTNINTNLNEFCKILDPILGFFPTFSSPDIQYILKICKEKQWKPQRHQTEQS